jgi:phage tail tape-measure protein
VSVGAGVSVADGVGSALGAALGSALGAALGSALGAALGSPLGAAAAAGIGAKSAMTSRKTCRTTRSRNVRSLDELCTRDPRFPVPRSECADSGVTRKRRPHV